MKNLKSKLGIRRIIPLALIAVGLIQLGACSKSKDINPKDEEILNKKISDIIPQKYMDSLTKLGFEINMGTNAPNVEGAYSFSPSVLKKSNIPGDVSPGYTFNPGKIKLYEQNSKDFGIKLLGKNFISTADTSVVTAISGSGNKFTVYGKVKSSKGSYYSYFAFLMSGEKDGNTIKNAIVGILNIDHSHGAPDVIKEGQGRVAYDSDKISESINFESTTANKQSDSFLSLSQKNILHP